MPHKESKRSRSSEENEVQTFNKHKIIFVYYLRLMVLQLRASERWEALPMSLDLM